MFKKEKSNPWDLSDQGAFKDQLLVKLKSTPKNELSDIEMALVMGGASDLKAPNQDRCAFWIDDETGHYNGCTNCQNRTCKDID